MQRQEQYNRDQKLLKFLTTPIVIDGEIIRDKKGRLCYPTLSQASKKFHLTIETISRKKHEHWEKFNQLKNDVVLPSVMVATNENS